MKIKNLNYKIDSTEILEDISFEVENNSVNVIVGSNGAGKTTLLKVISKVIEQKNIDINELNNNYKIVFVDQDFLIFDELIVEEFILLINNLNKNDIKISNLIIEDFMILGIDNILKTQIKNLSFGQRQKLIILMGFLSLPDYLLLDEPFNGLDYNSKINLRKLLKKYKKFFSFIITTHDIDNIHIYADKIMYLEKGRLQKILNIGEYCNEQKIIKE